MNRLLKLVGFWASAVLVSGWCSLAAGNWCDLNFQEGYHGRTVVHVRNQDVAIVRIWAEPFIRGALELPDEQASSLIRGALLRSFYDIDALVLDPDGLLISATRSTLTPSLADDPERSRWPAIDVHDEEGGLIARVFVIDQAPWNRSTATSRFLYNVSKLRPWDPVGGVENTEERFATITSLLAALFVFIATLVIFWGLRGRVNTRRTETLLSKKQDELDVSERQIRSLEACEVESKAERRDVNQQLEEERTRRQGLRIERDALSTKLKESISEEEYLEALGRQYELEDDLKGCQAKLSKRGQAETQEANARAAGEEKASLKGVLRCLSRGVKTAIHLHGDVLKEDIQRLEAQGVALSTIEKGILSRGLMSQRQIKDHHQLLNGGRSLRHSKRAEVRYFLQVQSDTQVRLIGILSQRDWHGTSGKASHSRVLPKLDNRADNWVPAELD